MRDFKLQYPQSPAAEALCSPVFGELKPSHLPLLTTPPPTPSAPAKPAPLVLSFCLCVKTSQMFFFFRPLLNNLGGLRVLQRIAVLIQTLVFCRVSWSGCSVIVHIGALAELALFFFEGENPWYHLSHPITLKKVEALAVLFGRRTASFIPKRPKTSCAVGREVIGFADRGAGNSPFTGKGL